MNDVLLETTLQLAVPIAIRKLWLTAGPTDEEWEWAREFADELGSRGDIILYRGKKGESAEMFAKLARAIAIMAYADGGITIFGRHWEAMP